MRKLILVNGVPASGKSTFMTALVDHLTKQGIPAVPFSLDAVKEGLFVHIGTGDRDHNRMLGRASYHSIFKSLAAFPQHLIPVIDAWHGFQPVSVLQDHLKEAKIERVIEVWCKISPAIAAERYRTRAGSRKPGHPPASYAAELFELTSNAQPLAIGPVVEINTEKPLSDTKLTEIAELMRDI